MRDLRAILTWLHHEARAAAGFAREREIWIALAGGLLLWTLGYQAPYAHRLDIGGSLQAGRRYDDTPFLDNFNDSEPNPIPDHATLLYRWSRADSTIAFPGIGGGRWLARVRAGTGSRPDLVLSKWDDGTHTYIIAATKAQRDYEIVVEADSAGDLTLHIATPPLTPAGDPRILGLVISRVVVAPIGGGRAPAARQLALLALALALIYALLRRFMLSRRPALACALALAALAALLLARERMALTLLTPLLPAILAGCYALGLGLDALLWIADCRLQIADYRTNNPKSKIQNLQSPIIALILLAVALRLGGMLHPHAIFSDDGLNAHNLIGFTSGQVYFTEGLPSEAGGGQAPYPPGQYIMVAPAQLLLQTGLDGIASLRLLLKIANAVWDSLVVGFVWYVLRRCGCGRRAALLGAALYVLPPPLLKSLSVGEFANVFGQGLALPLLALLATRVRELRQKKFLLVLLALFALALLGHLGVVISLAGLLICLGLIWLTRQAYRGAFLALLLAGLLAGVLVALFYYTALWDVLINRIGSSPATASGLQSPTIAHKLAQQAGSVHAYGIHALALVLGLLGVVLVALARSRGRSGGAMPGLAMLLLAWWGGTLLSLGLLLFANQGVRWQSFLYPVLCLGAGPALAALSARGRAARVVMVGLVVFLAWYGLAFWVVQISDYLH
ncbi:MAG: hypothetical protein ABIV47_16270 [Roseiflexaceae bacterium]